MVKGHFRLSDGKPTWVAPHERNGEMVEIRCRGCRKKMGVGHGHPQQKLFCSTLCAEDFPVFDNTERDDVIEKLVTMRGWDATRIAVNFDVSRQRAYQILKERGLSVAAS